MLRLFAVLLYLAIVHRADAIAQSASDSLPVTLPTVSITATRSDRDTPALPVTVSVFGRAALRDLGITHVADVLRLVPGATVLSNGSFGSQTSLFLRGGESDYVLVLVDGVPLNAPGGAFDFGSLTIDNIERVEVVRGPVSVLYGSDAVTGVIQIVTRTGSGAPALNLLAGGGSYGTRRFEAAAAAGQGRTSWSIGAARHRTDGILAFNNQYFNDVLSGALRWRAARADMAATVRYTDYTFHYPTNSAGEPVDSNAMSGEARLAAGVELGWRPTPRAAFRVRASQSVADTRTRDLPDHPADDESYVADGKIVRRGIEGRTIVPVGRAHTFTAAVDYTSDNEESASSFSGFESRSDAARRNAGVALQIDGQVGALAGYLVGVRRDMNSEFGTFTTIRGGLARHVGRGTTLRWSYGTAFKAPTFFENFATGFVRGNPNLDPERSASLEVGVHQSVAGGRGIFSATGFAQRFRDVIQYLATVAADEPNYVNVAGARANGIEVEARWRLGEQLTARASATFLDTKVTDAGGDDGPSGEFVEGERLLRRPTRSATAGLDYHGPGGVRIGAIAMHTGKRDDRDFSVWPAERIVLDAFSRVDLSAVLPLPSSRLRAWGGALVLRVENLFDASFQHVRGFRAPGRTVFGGVRLGRS